MNSVVQVPARRRLTLPPRLRAMLLPFFKPTRSVLWEGGLKTFLLVHPVAFELWFRARAAWFLVPRLWRRRSRTVKSNWPAPGFFDRVFDHNYSLRWMFNRNRTEKLLNVLRCIGDVSPDSKILVIGPRNEAELLLMSLYGFKLHNITGIDLFSYSPKILCMDMHKMEFPSNAFDIVYVSWVLKYSYDLRKACSEILRVARNGGLIATGWTHTPVSSQLVGKGSELAGGLRELFEHFSPHVDHIYWQNSDPTPEASGVYMLATIFKVKK